jgi:hypothetical protein
MRHTTEAIVGAFTGSLHAPTAALLGRNDERGHLRYTGRTTTLHATVRHALADQLHAADADHPWTGCTFTVGWGSRKQLPVHLVVPEAVAEVAVDVTRDSAGHWRHPVRHTRIRTDAGPGEVPRFGRPSSGSGGAGP